MGGAQIGGLARDFHISHEFGNSENTCPACGEYADDLSVEAWETFGRWMCHACADAEFERIADEDDTPLIAPASVMLSLRDIGNLTACLAGMVICFRLAWGVF